MATAQSFSRNGAAKFLGMSPRSFSRRVRDGLIVPDEDGTFDKDSLEEFRSEIEEAEEVPPETQIVTLLGDALKQAQDHNERLLQLLEKPTNAVLKTVEQVNTNLTERMDRQDSNMLEYMKALGDFYMHKDEREAIREEAAARSETLRKAGLMVAEHLPTLLAQMGGKGGVALDKVSAFAKSLSDEQKEGLGQLAGMFEGEQQAHFIELLKVMGIKPHIEETEEAAEEPEPDETPDEKKEKSDA